MRIGNQLFLLSSFLMSCTSIGPINSVDSMVIPDKTIFIGKGVGCLILNHSTKREVDKYLGNGEEVKFRVSFANHSTKIKRVRYNAVGIEAEYSNLSDINQGDTLKVLTILNSCEFQTANGIKIGTSRSQIEKLLGVPESSTYKKLIDDSIYHSITYDRVEFEFNDTIYKKNLTGSSEVREITLW